MPLQTKLAARAKTKAEYPLPKARVQYEPTDLELEQEAEIRRMKSHATIARTEAEAKYQRMCRRARVAEDYCELVRNKIQCSCIELPEWPEFRTEEEYNEIIKGFTGRDKTAIDSDQIEAEENVIIRQLRDIVKELKKKIKELESVKDNPQQFMIVQHSSAEASRVTDLEERLRIQAAQCESIRQELIQEQQKSHKTTIELEQANIHINKLTKELSEFQVEEKAKEDIISVKNEQYLFLFDMSKSDSWPESRRVIAEYIMEITEPSPLSSVSYTDLAKSLLSYSLIRLGPSRKTIYIQLKELLADKAAAYIHGIKLI